jgi:hypothetical protein
MRQGMEIMGHPAPEEGNRFQAWREAPPSVSPILARQAESNVRVNRQQ